MASLGLGATRCLLQRRFLAMPFNPATPRIFDAPRSRLLSNTAFRLNAAAKPVPKTIKAAPAAPKTKSHPVASGSIAPTRYAFIKSLGTKSTPTTLYEAPSHFWYYFGCWSSGLTILAWTVLTGPTVVKQPEGIPDWVGYVFGASYVLLGSMAFYLISKTPNVVRSIRLLPALTSPAQTIVPGAAAATKAAKPVTAAANAVTAMPQIEVIVNRMVPILPAKVFTTSLDNVLLKTRFSLPDELVPGLRRQEQHRAAEEARVKLHKFDMQHLLTMPFRRIGRVISGFFGGVRAAWTDMGFGAIKVDGKEFKVDVTKGFAHDGFRTLERLVTVGY